MSEKSETALAAYHSSDTPEKLVLGVYVDNLQIVHSHPIDQEGTKVKELVEALQRDWDVEDEGIMRDLLGIEIRYNDDGSITLHQQTYIEKLVKEFLPYGPSTGIKGNVPYSQNLDKISWHATRNRVENKGTCAHPELVKEYQRKLADSNRRWDNYRTKRLIFGMDARGHARARRGRLYANQRWQGRAPPTHACPEQSAPSSSSRSRRLSVPDLSIRRRWASTTRRSWLLWMNVPDRVWGFVNAVDVLSVTGLIRCFI